MAKVVYYSGTVQGVGFRATVAHLARGRPIRGWVRNLPDGRVELLADGRDSDISEFLAAIRERMADYITREDITERASDPNLHGFRITY